MNAEIVSVGTEILLGEIVDTNSNYIALALRDIGVNVFFITAVGDNLQRITNTLRLGLARSDLIITTGGLGPTVDDMTRQAIAGAVDRELEFRQELYEQIAERFARFNVRMSENNRQQAHIPVGAIPIENPVGTAPCFIVEDEAGIIICLPGVPTEMKYLLKERVIPYLQQKLGASTIIRARILKTAGIGESHLDEMIADLMTLSNPTVGLAAHTGQTDIRITARAASDLEVEAMLDDLEAKVRERVDGYIYGTGDEPLEHAVVSLLQSQNRKIATSETGMASVLKERIMGENPHVLADSEHYLTIAELSQQLALSDDTSLTTMSEVAAKHLLENSPAAIAIAIVKGAEETAMAVASPNNVRGRAYRFGNEEERAAVWAGNWSLSIAWKTLKDME